MNNPRIDFAKILDDIAYLRGDRVGLQQQLVISLSQESLARVLGVSRGALRGWLEGSQPGHGDGEKLLTAWCELTGKARSSAYVVRTAMSAHKTMAPHRMPR